MASTARHRANPSPRTWAARGLLAATTVPVGALAGCVVAAAAATASSPGLGVAGLAVAGVPLTLHGLRARRTARRVRVRGRHVAGLELLAPAAAGAPVAVRLDPAVDPAAPSPAAASALALVPVADAGTGAELARLADAGAAGVALLIEEAVEAVEEAAAEAHAVVVALPAPRSPQDDAADVADAVDAAAAAEPRAEVVVRVGAEPGDLVVRVEQPGPPVAPEQRAAEIAQLNRLWAAGTGPDTGSLRITAAA